MGEQIPDLSSEGTCFPVPQKMHCFLISLDVDRLILSLELEGLFGPEYNRELNINYSLLIAEILNWAVFDSPSTL